MGPRRTLALALAGVVATSGAGWAAGSRMRSPADAADGAAAPEASLITSPVERRTLSARVTTRGTVRYGEPRRVTLAASALEGAGGGRALVTRPPEKGAQLDEDSVALEVSGRPVRVLAGEVPMYRDLGPGDRGDDVRQLEEALSRLGFRPGPVDGLYDGATEGAVEDWYEAAGYRAQGPTDAQRQALRTARSARSAAEDQVLQTRSALAAAARGPSAREVSATGADLRAAEREMGAARDALDAARVDEQAARAAEAAARAEEDRLRAGGAGEHDLRQAAAATAQAAEAAVRAARSVPAAARAVDAAGDRVATAQAALEALRAPVDTTTAGAAVAKAERDATEAAAHLAELEAETGVVVPANEVLFLPSLPLRVDEAKVARGDDGGKEIMVVSTSRLAIDASLSIPDARLVEVGDAVRVDSRELGIEVAGTVTDLADRPGTDGVDAQRVAMEVVPEEAPPELTGASVALTIAVESTGGEVLAVPLAALSVGADGTSRVEVATGTGRATRTVAVEPGLAAEGFVEVRPAGGGLAEGDRVVVGTAGTGSAW